MKRKVNLTFAIPRHLLKIFHADEKACDENHSNGEICCDCGCKRFHIRLFADTENESQLEAFEYEEDWALVIKIICADCKKEWLLFDMSQHGYDGYVCHEGVTVPDSELQGYGCPNCGEAVFEIGIGIEEEDREQFNEEIVQDDPDNFSEEDYVDAFNWITIDLKCSGCEKEQKGWLDLEMA